MVENSVMCILCIICVLVIFSDVSIGSLVVVRCVLVGKIIVFW